MNRDKVNKFAGCLVSIGYSTHEVSDSGAHRRFVMHEGGDNEFSGGYMITYPNRISDDDLFLKVIKVNIITENGKVKVLPNSRIVSDSELDNLISNAYDIKIMNKQISKDEVGEL